MARDSSRFDMGISYTPGKANVMADALSRKAYCSALEVQVQQPHLYEEFHKLNLEIVPQGSLNSLNLNTDLEYCVKLMQHHDDLVHKITRDIANGKPSFFTVDDEGVVFFKDRLVVPVNKGYRAVSPQSMKEDHDSPLSIHPGSTKMYHDIHQQFWWPGMKSDIARYVAECDV